MLSYLRCPLPSPMENESTSLPFSHSLHTFSFTSPLTPLCECQSPKTSYATVRTNALWGGGRLKGWRGWGDKAAVATCGRVAGVMWGTVWGSPPSACCPGARPVQENGPLRFQKRTPEEGRPRSPSVTYPKSEALIARDCFLAEITHVEAPAPFLLFGPHRRQ